MSALLKRLMDKIDGEGDDLGGAPENNDGVGTGNDARVALLEKINDANDEVRAEEFVEIDDAGQVTEFVPSKTETLLPTGDEADEAATQAELDRLAKEANLDTPVPEKHKIKVNGKEIELTMDEIIARAQKVEAADTYLAEASRLRKEAEDKAKVETQPSVPSKEDQAAAQIERRRALVRAIQMGTEEEAMAAVEELQRPAPPAFTADDLARTVDERLTFKEAVGKFEDTYKDITSDPVLLKLVLDKDREFIAQGDKRPYYERYSALGDEVRAWRDGIIKAVTPPADPIKDKQTRKASAPATPKAASVKVPAKQEEDDTEESPAAVIAAIREARGGPQWMRN